MRHLILLMALSGCGLTSAAELGLDADTGTEDFDVGLPDVGTGDSTGDAIQGDGSDSNLDSGDRSTDTDGDGIPDWDEHILGTDPAKADTDGGGTNDGDEVEAGTNPWWDGDDPNGGITIDSDGDGLLDSEESQIGTDPHNPDTDNGGTWDGVEVERGTNPWWGGDD